MKTLLLVTHGRSTEELDNKIQEFKDLDVVWASINNFSIPEEHILSKIGKKFSVVFDCSTVKNGLRYDTDCRIPKLTEFLDRDKNNIYITARNSLYTLRSQYFPEFQYKYKTQGQIIYAEDIGVDSKVFEISLPIYIACLIKLGYTKIVMFGADGGGKYVDSSKNYFRQDLVLKEKMIACGKDSEEKHFQSQLDTARMNEHWSRWMQRSIGYVPEIINCSPGTNYTVFKNMSYDETLNYLKG